MSSILEQLQNDIAQRLEAGAFFNNIPIRVQRRRAAGEAIEVEQALAEALTGLTPKLGGGDSPARVGAALIVLMPGADTPDPSIPGPWLRGKFVVRVSEAPMLNMGPAGTGKSAEEIAQHVLLTLHRWRPGYGVEITAASAGALRPLPAASQDNPALVTYDVSFEAEFGLMPEARCSMPIASGAVGEVTLSLTPPNPDARIWYTTDGSLPRPDGPTSTQYPADHSAPLNMTGHALLRAAAYAVDPAEPDAPAGSSVMHKTYA